MNTKTHLLALKLGIANKKIEELESKIKRLENTLNEYENESRKSNKEDYTILSWLNNPESMGN